MNVNTGHIVDRSFWDTDTGTPTANYVEVPEHLNRAARRKLAGKKEAHVAMNSGGKLSRWARGQRKAQKSK